MDKRKRDVKAAEKSQDRLTKQTESEANNHFDCFKYFTKGVEKTIGKISKAVGKGFKIEHIKISSAKSNSGC